MSPPRGRRTSFDSDPLSPRRRHHRRARRRRRRRGALAAIAVLAAVVAVAGVGGGAAVFAYGSSCDLDSLNEVDIGANTFVYAADGSLLGSIPAERNREPVDADAMSVWMRKATIAVEDRRFFEHGGVDVEGIARAAVTDLKAGRIVEGGSTITQQLVRNLYISNERTVQRKLKEACLATKLDRAWTKHRILTTYLNQVYYGNQAYGIEAAAQTYFSKSAAKLTLSESALLAGLTQAPSVYDPFTAATRAIARRAVVLRSMLETGVLTRKRHAKAVSSKLRLRPGRLYRDIREPYFFGYVRDRLIEEYGAAQVRSGGMKVFTTIKPRYQRLAEEAIRNTMTEPTDPAAALISISPRTGAIRAMAAIIPNRPKNEFNLLSQARRQPGSTFKTFVLAAAVEDGIDPDSTYYVSAPFTYRPHPAGNCDDGSWWCVHTYANDYYGWSSIRSATIRSDNAVYAQLTLDVTPERVAQVARRMGVRSPLDVKGAFVPAMGLGSVAVSPLDLASSYATLAAGGIYAEPMAIRRVVLPNGREDKDAGWGRPKRRRAISEGSAAVVTRILEQNMQSGTGTRAAFGRPAAGKTGTNEEHKDAWFAGYTPDLATTVWIGYTRAEIPMESVHGIAVSGGSFPAEIWRLFMEPALENVEPTPFAEPSFWPEWKPFTRGRYALTYDPYEAPAEETEEEEGEEEAEGESADEKPASKPATPGTGNPDLQP
jgi:penicillin-binding protein 1A